MSYGPGQGVLVAIETVVCADGVCGYSDVTDDCALCGVECPFCCDTCGQFFCAACVPGADCPQCRPEAYGEVG